MLNAECKMQNFDWNMPRSGSFIQHFTFSILFRIPTRRIHIMNCVTIRVPATTANLGPGFDAFGCALSLYTDVTFEETDFGLEITGCDEAFTGPDNLAYTAYCAVLNTMSEDVRGVKIHIDAHIPICRGLGSSAALLVAGAMGANVLRGNKLSTQGLLNITNAMEGHPDNLAPAFFGGLTASMVDGGLPVCVSFPLHAGWEFLALIPEFTLSTTLARSVLPEQVNRRDAIYNVSHGALVLKALELGDEKLLRTAMQDRLHQEYRKKLIPDYEKIEALVRTTGAAFCLSGAGPTLLCITRNPGLEEKLAKKLDSITEHHWQMLPLHVEFQGAHVLTAG